MHKNNGATKVFPETATPQLPKILSKVGIFLKKYAADIVADAQNTGNNTKQRFLLLSYVQI